ncbi:DNA-binding response regulator [bacterium (Candidatus Blackallbacteria) CG17_big_fil_post_rev_8_21_14_2_50_48_46]|uniref:DNA-binding response regulator n=1 Tax=bacterium (Candidatus Blackallbacteria) CG17_big_fil_post_rev_8_21_14_2_50_48_46 TaxID=2014261 RepID=A0A2M7G286_9BACT|nr:MAG: DNA-binding response regulator [bacterium (Candidatus Blackallbacteria) CG18_big_fil_WC_8_21_14_2_50_49_26]PIW15895.1 MAG: DNA-binding response regulator [bacterium (Candidatus Blackallbacteria) CG17_big_fil_post_rev_8_21_14_2_50_48_46]PIW48640.1 MAG: DNA-binding response regulator [bacterium (Candidatus Blackallbacteria) CG13_big_fil_rev_8_21_14_2_50_49_14]
MPQIHLIDDDSQLHELLKAYFSAGPLELSGSETPSAGLAWLEQNPADLVILDLMLPEMDGFEVCRRLRAQWPKLPVLMLTARGDDLNTIMGLELGADDFMSKPFNPRELEARIKSILRRTENAEPAPPTRHLLCSEQHALQLDLDAHTATHQGQWLDLTPTEFDLLRCLMENRGIVQSRDQLIQKLRGYDWESLDRSVDMHISKLRQKLGDTSKKPQIIKTVWGIGYLFPAAP